MTTSNKAKIKSKNTDLAATAPADIAPAELRSPRSGTKQNAVLALLRRSDGATIGAIMDATSWQKHSVRGFLAGVVRKKLGLTLASIVADGQRTYRIVTAPQPAPRIRKRRSEASAAAQP